MSSNQVVHPISFLIHHNCYKYDPLLLNVAFRGEKIHANFLLKLIYGKIIQNITLKSK